MAKYKIISFEKARPPEGSKRKCWYQYIIQNEANTITGVRSGSKYEVRSFASTAVTRLNEKYPTSYKIKNHHRPVNDNEPTSFL